MRAVRRCPRPLDDRVFSKKRAVTVALSRECASEITSEMAVNERERRKRVVCRNRSRSLSLVPARSRSLHYERRGSRCGAPMLGQNSIGVCDHLGRGFWSD
jgi:hypothetical protein